MQKFIEENTKLLGFVGVFLGLFLIVSTINKVKEYRFIGSGTTATNTITVSGRGKVDRSPDTAKISFSIRNENKDLSIAQKSVSDKIDGITKDLIASGIEEKYIKTDSYTSYPQYDYPRSVCTYAGCPVSTPKLRGYEVSHSVTISVKDLTKVEEVLGTLGKASVTDIQGPNFGFEDDKAIARESRDMAIADAKAEATKLAKSLGVHLVRIVSFNENGGGYPMPMYATGAMMKNEDAVSNPSIPVGDQSVESNVTIVYEIR